MNARTLLFLLVILSTGFISTSCNNQPECITCEEAPDPDPNPEPDPDPDPTVTACGSDTHFTDPRDNQTYELIQIGNACWMAQNLNYETENSWCYEDKSGNCELHGRLYRWEDAVNACPPGWHLPTEQEWLDLAAELGGAEVAGGKMKLEGTRYWESPNEGATNESGFSSLPSGFRGSGGAYNDMGRKTYFWTSTNDPRNDAFAIYRVLASINGELGDWYIDKRAALSVRCVKD